MKRGAAPPKERRAMRAHVRALIWLLSLGVLLCALGPLYGWLAINHSGALVLRQQISAADVARGFDFGPVYLEQGAAGRYFLSAVLPEVDGDWWHTTFEVLSDSREPVFHQDELRIIGDFDLEPGQRERHAKRFTLDKDSGYYYFRYRAVNGVYDANPDAPPVVEFAVRQRVIAGAALWVPVGASLALGLLLLWLAVSLMRHLGRRQTRRRPPDWTVSGPSGGRTEPWRGVVRAR